MMKLQQVLSLSVRACVCSLKEERKILIHGEQYHFFRIAMSNMISVPNPPHPRLCVRNCVFSVLFLLHMACILISVLFGAQSS